MGTETPDVENHLIVTEVTTFLHVYLESCRIREYGFASALDAN